MAKIAKLAPRSYEEFQASFEWIQEEEGADILRIPLPGFKKDHIKVQMDTLGNLRVTGESPLGGAGNRWRRFRKDFRIPDNCNAGEIRAKFDDDVLDIVLPRLDAAAAAAVKPRHQQPQLPTPPPQQPPPRVGDGGDQDHTIRSRKESTSRSNTGGGAAPLAKPTVDARAKERSTGEPAGKREEALKVERTDDTADGPRREESAAEEAEARAGGAEKDGSGKPKLGASLSFDRKPNQLLMNVGVAVGVLVGLASYLAYNLGKSVGGAECHCH